jgi:hypothetical protein
MTLRNTVYACLLLSLSASAPLQADDGRWKVVKQGVVEDTFTGTQWTQRDNLADINWHDAKAHCSSLALDGGGWRLPSMQELSMLYSGAQGNKVPCANWQCTAPKAFYLTGTAFWSGDPGKGSSEAWYFDLDHGTRNSAAVSYPGLTRALCVRRRS